MILNYKANEIGLFTIKDNCIKILANISKQRNQYCLMEYINNTRIIKECDGLSYEMIERKSSNNHYLSLLDSDAVNRLFSSLGMQNNTLIFTEANHINSLPNGLYAIIIN